MEYKNLFKALYHFFMITGLTILLLSIYKNPQAFTECQLNYPNGTTYRPGLYGNCAFLMQYTDKEIRLLQFQKQEQELTWLRKLENDTNNNQILGLP